MSAALALMRTPHSESCGIFGNRFAGRSQREANETPSRKVLGQQRRSVDLRERVEHRLQRPSGAKSGRKAPGGFVEANDLDAAGRGALDQQVDRAGAEVE